MGRLLLIDVVGSVAVLGLWYLIFSRYNQKQGVAALRRVQAAWAGSARVLEAQWSGSSRVHARLHFATHWFENARVTVKFQPRALPLKWLLSHFRHEKETLTFEADLGGSPSFYLEVMRHRWSAHSRGTAGKREDKHRNREWELYQPGPVLLTTRTQRKRDSSAEINALMSARNGDILEVKFRPQSPQFSATVRLEALGDPAAAAGFVNTLREIATGASAHRR